MTAIFLVKTEIKRFNKMESMWTLVWSKNYGAVDRFVIATGLPSSMTSMRSQLVKEIIDLNIIQLCFVEDK